MKLVFAGVALSLALAALEASPAAATGILQIRPAHPTSADTVIVVSGDSFPATCWGFGAVSCSTIGPDTLFATTLVDFCGGSSEYCDCADYPPTYLRYCTFGQLSPGSYVAKYTEVHTNRIDPIRTFTRTLNFTVDAVTPTLKRTWGALKSVYR